MRAGTALVASGAAHAQTRLSLTPQLSVGAGYDDNLFLDANPANTKPGQLPQPTPHADAGERTELTVSLPVPARAKLQARETAVPPEEPPGVRVRS